MPPSAQPNAKRPSPFADGDAAADYIATMAKDLSAIAQHHGLDTLSYLLDIVSMEAESGRG